MIGIIGAMSVEVEGLKDKLSDKKTEILGGIEFSYGKISGKEVVVARCGIGKVFAAICAQIMINRFSPDVIINSGVAGSLTEKLGILDVAISTSVVQHDMDTSPIGDPVGLISGINLVEIPADRRLADIVSESADELGIKYLSGIVASGDQFVATREKKMQIADSFGAICCEMEGAALGQVCYVNSVEYVIIRAISDSLSGDGGMEYSEFVSVAAKRSEELVTSVIKKI